MHYLIILILQSKCKKNCFIEIVLLLAELQGEKYFKIDKNTLNMTSLFKNDYLDGV